MLDVMLPDMSGIDAFKTIHHEYPQLPVVFISGGSTSESAIEAMRLGAFDYVLKPLDRETFQVLWKRALDARQTELITASTAESIATPGEHASLVGSSAQMHDVYKSIGKVAPQHVTVLIRGESGTGKQCVARSIHRFSPRSEQPFVVVDCAALPATLLENELFGCEDRWAGGTGTVRQGKCEQFPSGTLYLNEIGDMEPPTQGKLLRLLHEQKFERVGGHDQVDSNVRVIGATTRNLEQMVAAGTFRQDLYYQLKVFTIDLPPLRQRRSDIPLLAEYFLARFNQHLDTDVHGIAPDALQLLVDYQWPGNVRELESMLKQAMVRATAPVLGCEFFSPTLKQRLPDLPNGSSAAGDWQEFIRVKMEEGTDSLYSQTLHHMEKHLLTEVLQFTHGNKVRAAKILGMTRGTLRAKLASLGITVERVVGHENS
jgi:two-component system nitrogen regulation response regulator GlnG